MYTATCRIVSGSCSQRRELSLVLGDGLEGWDGGVAEREAREGSSRGRARMYTYSWFMLYGRN